MANEYFQPGSVPAPNAPGSSAVMRQEFASISAGFDKLPILAGHAGEIVTVNSTGTALITSGAVIGDYVTKDGVFTLTNKTIAWADNLFPGFGDAATRNAGKNAGQVLLLENNMQLPAIDGSLLTGLNTGMIAGTVTVSQGGTGATTVAGAQAALGIDLKANAFNAVLTGAPTAPTPPTGDNSARIATTYFVTNTITDIGSFAPSNATPLMDGVGAPGVGTLGSRDDHVHPTDTSRAPLASPALTGTPTAPTAPVQTDTTQIATTEFVNAEIEADRPYSNANPLINGAAAQGTSPRVSRQDHVHPTDTSRAPLASPTFTGIPAAPTPATNTNTTQIATTAFVQSLIAQQPPGVQVSNSAPLMNGVAAPGVGVEASRWDHVHPTDSSRAPSSAATASGTSFAPSGNIQATNVQAAIQELDSEKVSKSGDTMTGVLTVPMVVASSTISLQGPSDTTGTIITAGTYTGAGNPYIIMSGPNAGGWSGRTFDIQLVSGNGGVLGVDANGPYSGNQQGTSASSLTRKDYVDAPLFFGANDQMGVVPNNTATKLGIESAGVQVDSDSWWDATNRRYIPKRAGYYRATVFVSGNATGGALTCAASAAKNGVVSFEGTLIYGGALAGVSDMRSTYSTIFQMNGTTDYIEPFGRIAGSGTLKLGMTTLEIEFIRP